ncbi:MAG: hypothetical protein OXI73_02685 [Rhodospirillales bacterium]|nr:hypothetical protein [Rhodospirillales bacterium]
MLASAALGTRELAERQGAHSIACKPAGCPFAAFRTQMLGGGTVDPEIGKAKRRPLAPLPRGNHEGNSKWPAT